MKVVDMSYLGKKTGVLNQIIAMKLQMAAATVVGRQPLISTPMANPAFTRPPT